METWLIILTIRQETEYTWGLQIHPLLSPRPRQRAETIIRLRTSHSVVMMRQAQGAVRPTIPPMVQPFQSLHLSPQHSTLAATTLNFVVMRKLKPASPRRARRACGYEVCQRGCKTHNRGITKDCRLKLTFPINLGIIWTILWKKSPRNNRFCRI